MRIIQFNCNCQMELSLAKQMDKFSLVDGNPTRITLPNLHVFLLRSCLGINALLVPRHDCNSLNCVICNVTDLQLLYVTLE